MKIIKAPLSGEDVKDLNCGDQVLVQGTIYAARDAAHKRLVETLAQGEALPLDLTGQIFYYVGPCPAPPGRVIGSAGPTTSGRMDSYAPLLLEHGLKGMIGKGERSSGVVEAMKKCGAVYLATVGGAGAYLARRITASRPRAYSDLGPEALLELAVKDFPCIVAIDCYGRSIYDRRRISSDAGEL